MFLMRLIARFFAPAATNADNGFRRPHPAAGRPHRHFREFTLPRRLQRGGGFQVSGRGERIRGLGGIIPRAGENIP